VHRARATIGLCSDGMLHVCLTLIWFLVLSGLQLQIPI
jgi:hypothetical protein